MINVIGTSETLAIVEAMTPKHSKQTRCVARAKEALLVLVMTPTKASQIPQEINVTGTSKILNPVAASTLNSSEPEKCVVLVMEEIIQVEVGKFLILPNLSL